MLGYSMSCRPCAVKKSGILRSTLDILRSTEVVIIEVQHLKSAESFDYAAGNNYAGTRRKVSSHDDFSPLSDKLVDWYKKSFVI